MTIANDERAERDRATPTERSRSTIRPASAAAAASPAAAFGPSVSIRWTDGTMTARVSRRGHGREGITRVRTIAQRDESGSLSCLSSARGDDVEETGGERQLGDAEDVEDLSRRQLRRHRSARRRRRGQQGGQLHEQRVEAAADPEDGRENMQELRDQAEEIVHEPG